MQFAIPTQNPSFRSALETVVRCIFDAYQQYPSLSAVRFELESRFPLGAQVPEFDLCMLGTQSDNYARRARSSVRKKLGAQPPVNVPKMNKRLTDLARSNFQAAGCSPEDFALALMLFRNERVTPFSARNLEDRKQTLLENLSFSDYVSYLRDVGTAGHSWESPLMPNAGLIL